eukprot:948671_1
MRVTILRDMCMRKYHNWTFVSITIHNTMSTKVSKHVCCKRCLCNGLSFVACTTTLNNFSRHLTQQHGIQAVKRKTYYYELKQDGKTPEIPTMDLLFNAELKKGYDKAIKANDQTQGKRSSKNCVSQTKEHLDTLINNGNDKGIFD